MKKTVFAILLLASCGRSNPPVGLTTEADSLAYVLGMNAAWQLQQVDSTLHVEAFAAGVRDVFAGTPHFTEEQARTVFLAYENVSKPAAVARLETKFLEDFRTANRQYAKNDAGLTYAVEQVGDETKSVRSDRDTVALRYTASTVDGRQVIRQDSTRSAVADLQTGLAASVRLTGPGGKVSVWVPAAMAYGSEGNAEKNIGPNATLHYQIEILEVKRR